MTLSNRRLPWRFGLPFLLKLAIVLAIPIPTLSILANGETLYLQTAPIDPYDLLRGRYVTLAYAVEDRQALAQLPGWPENADLSDLELPELGDRQPRWVYLVMEPAADGEVSSVDREVLPWRATQVTFQRPTELARGQRLLKARYSRYGNVDVGLSQYFIPESIGDELERDIREHRDATVAEVKVDRFGNGVLVGLWVENRHY